MNEDNNVQTPNFEGEAMKMPENTNATPAQSDTKSEVLSAPLLVILTLLLLIILGGMYYWFTTLSVAPAPITVPEVERPTIEENNEPESTTAEAEVETLLTTSPSDEITAIEADLTATDFDNLDAELNAIDAELEAGVQEQP